MDREKLVKIVLESEEDLDLGDIRMLQEKDIPDSLFITELNTLAGDLDWSIGSPASECFDENEELSDHGSEVKYFAKVTSDEYIIPNARQVKYFSSKFKLMDGFQGLYSVEHVDLY